MKTMTGKTESRHSTLAEVLAMKNGDQAAVHGMVHTLRDLGDVRFALLRMPQGVLQMRVVWGGHGRPRRRRGDDCGRGCPR